MDPNTVVIILAANLICSGGLFYLIGRRMPRRSGVLHWAVGSVLFGLAYLVRLVGGRDMGFVINVLLDTTMVVSALLFLAGIRRWVGHPPVRRLWLMALAAGYALTQGLSVGAAGEAGRYFLLNAVLAMVYGWIAFTGARAMRSNGGALQAPLVVLTLLMGVLGLLTGLRSMTIVATGGTAVLYVGLAAQIYYGYASLAVVLMALNMLWMVFARLNTQLHELATRDALTRVLNRNGLADVLARHFAARDALPITLLEVDVDHFKRINDQHGHGVGDAVLRAVADVLAKRVRGNDFVARIGGEEFLVGCVGGDGELALALGQRLGAGVAELLVPGRNGRSSVSCTVSVGVSTPFNTLDDHELAMQEADQALYAAKAGGRNRVVVFDGEATTDETVPSRLDTRPGALA